MTYEELRATGYRPTDQEASVLATLWPLEALRREHFPTDPPAMLFRLTPQLQVDFNLEVFSRCNEAWKALGIREQRRYLNSLPNQEVPWT